MTTVRAEAEKSTNSVVSKLSNSKWRKPKGLWCVPWASFILPYSLERYHLAPALLRRVGRLRFRLGCGRFHEAADLLRYNSLHMCIGVQGKSGAVVAQHTGQHFHIHTAGEAHGCECVVQVVKPNLRLLAPASPVSSHTILQQYASSPRRLWRWPGSWSHRGGTSCTSRFSFGSW